MARRTRPRITVTIDPDLLDEMDTYIRKHSGMDRSRLVDEALRCWYAQKLREALVRQHSAPESPEELRERLAWKGIRAEQALRFQVRAKHRERDYARHGFLERVPPGRFRPGTAAASGSARSAHRHWRRGHARRVTKIKRRICICLRFRL
ncbi:MAG: ribbon-helix-helix domain-containing protein [Dehalococcoidia bacterium]|nr:ribbon-helix-helix domain-containing protein [Dehalococcoidia bacterium]